MSRSEAHTLQNSLTELYNREKEFETACNNDADAEHAYKMKQAERFLAADGTEKARTAQAVMDSGDEFKTHLKAKAVKEFTKEKLRDSQQALSARQSLLTASTRSDQSYMNDKRVT